MVTRTGIPTLRSITSCKPIAMTKKTYDVEEMKDPWGGDIKMFRVQHEILGTVFGEANSSYTVERIRDENPGSKIINQWSEQISKLLFTEKLESE